MSRAKFNIMDSVAYAMEFTRREWRYMASISLLPVSLSIGTGLFLAAQSGQSFSILTIFLLRLPAIAFAGWFLFAITRLILLNERLGDDVDKATADDRRTLMRLSVSGWVLFNMMLMGITAYMLHAVTALRTQPDSSAGVVGMLLIGMGVWAARFAFSHILIAVDYPVRQYIYRVNGVAVSFRIIAQFLMIALPVAFLQNEITTLIIPDLKSAGMAVTSLAVLFNAIIDFITIAFWHIAGIFAVRQMLSTTKGGGRSA
jgi:hypothetical protein